MQKNAIIVASVERYILTEKHFVVNVVQS